MTTIREAIRANFPALAPDAVDTLAETARIGTYQPNVMLCCQGEIGDTFYILLAGRVDIFQNVADRRYYLGKITPAGCFGEIALLLDIPRSADVVSVSTIRTLEINRDEFNAYIQTYPEIVLAITRQIIQRFLDQERQLMLRISKSTQAELPSLFVSYSRRNKTFASTLTRDLHRYHYDVWLDTSSIVPGTEWQIAVRQALENTDIMILILSPDSIVSNEVRFEWEYYLEQGKIIIPILHRPCTMPAQLQVVQHIDFTQMDYEFAVAHLVQALQTHGQTMAGQGPTED